MILGIMACFGLEIITLTYLVSFIFKNSVYAFNKIGMWYVIFGLVLPMVLTLLVALAMAGTSSSRSFIENFKVWQGILCLDPFVGLALGLFYEVIYYQSLWESDYYCKKYKEPYYCDDPIGRAKRNLEGLLEPQYGCIIMGCAAVLYFCLSLLLDSTNQNKYKNTDTVFAGDRAYTLPPDEDVIREENLVRESQNDDYMVKTINLCKQYQNGPTAIRGNTFGIKQNEVLGLLGPNGAGKSTTFSILTMETSRSDGMACVLG
jgi:ABC-type multidrug transport system fused ATPase/permease subunit